MLLNHPPKRVNAYQRSTKGLNLPHLRFPTTDIFSFNGMAVSCYWGASQ